MSASELDAALTNTAHLYARASEKERLLRFFTDVPERLRLGPPRFVVLVAAALGGGSSSGP